MIDCACTTKRQSTTFFQTKFHIMKKTINLLVAVLCISVFFKTSTAQTSYEAINDGLWDSPLTWEPEGVPGENDIAVNPGAFEISINGDITVAEYHHEGGYLYFEANSSLTILEGGTWNNGWITGSSSGIDRRLRSESGLSQKRCAGRQ